MSKILAGFILLLWRNVSDRSQSQQILVDLTTMLTRPQNPLTLGPILRPDRDLDKSPQDPQKSVIQYLRSDWGSLS